MSPLANLYDIEVAYDWGKLSWLYVQLLTKSLPGFLVLRCKKKEHWSAKEESPGQGIGTVLSTVSSYSLPSSDTVLFSGFNCRVQKQKLTEWGQQISALQPLNVTNLWNQDRLTYKGPTCTHTHTHTQKTHTPTSLLLYSTWSLWCTLIPAKNSSLSTGLPLMSGESRKKLELLQ